MKETIYELVGGPRDGATIACNSTITKVWVKEYDPNIDSDWDFTELLLWSEVGTGGYQLCYEKLKVKSKQGKVTTTFKYNILKTLRKH